MTQETRPTFVPDPSPSTLTPRPARDRSAGLVIFGLGEVLIAGALLLLAAAGALIEPPAGVAAGPEWTRAGATSLYGLGGLFFGVVGFGSMLARRWARSLMLAAGWIWLILGAFATVAILLSLPNVGGLLQAQLEYHQGPGAPPVDESFVTMVKFVLVVVTLGLNVLLPAMFVLFYRSPNVQATVEYKDPQPRWTDRAPAPILALSGLFSLGSVSSFIAALSGAVVPWFGKIVTGGGGTAILVVVAVLLLLAAWGLLKMKPSGWWLALLLGLTGSASTAVNFGMGDWGELLRQMGLSSQQVDLYQKHGLGSAGTLGTMVAAASAAFLGFLLWARRYFGGDEEEKKPTVVFDPDSSVRT